MSELRKRVKEELPNPDVGAGISASESTHPAGPVKHSPVTQALLIFAFVASFFICITSINIAQFMAVPLYWINKDYFYAYMAVTKQLFTLFANSITQYFTPTTIRISGNSSVRGQLKLTSDGRLKTLFSERLVLIANHQIYTDWLYLWWISYTGHKHGHLYIILKESLKYIPIIGPGMMFFRFIFMARNWTTDKPRLQHRLQTFNSRHQGPLSGSSALDPMWLLIFPEGTNLSKNARDSSRKWSEKTGLADMQHQLLPRSTGLQFCLQELRETVDWVYDCTIGYEGIPRGEYGQDIFTLRSTYFQGRIPKSVNMYWRCFAVKSIPIDDSKAFEKWLLERWIEKDQFLEQFHQTGRFPVDDSGFIETMVQPNNRFEVLLLLLPLIPAAVFLFAVIGIFKVLWR